MTHTDTHTDTQTTYPNAVDGLRHKLPWRGLLLVLFIGLMSSELAHFVPKLGAVTIGILLGVLVLMHALAMPPTDAEQHPDCVLVLWALA